MPRRFHPALGWEPDRSDPGWSEWDRNYKDAITWEDEHDLPYNATCGVLLDEPIYDRHGNVVAQAGEPCPRTAGANTAHRGYGPCAKHGGRSPKAAKDAYRLRLDFEMRKVFREYRSGPIRDLATELAEVYADLAAYHAALSDRLEALREQGFEIDEMMLDPQQSRLVALFEKSLERKAKILLEAVKLGIINRSVSIEENIADLIVSAVSAALRERGYPADPELDAEIGRQLRIMQEAYDAAPSALPPV